METRRSNVQQEKLTAERDRATRELGFANLAESSRHNLESESFNRASLDETSRANRAKEAQNALNYLEQVRSNQATEQLERSKQEETHRNNVEREKETSLHNRNTEREDERSHRATETIRSAELSETVSQNRYYRRRDANQLIANLQLAREQMAQDLYIQNAKLEQQESQFTRTFDLNNRQFGETSRHNLATEQISAYNAATQRLATEGNLQLGQQQLFETTLHNRNTEQIQYLNAKTQAEQQQAQAQNYYNQFTLGLTKQQQEYELEKGKQEEVARHNIEMERQGMLKYWQQQDLYDAQIFNYNVTGGNQLFSLFSQAMPYFVGGN